MSKFEVKKDLGQALRDCIYLVHPIRHINHPHQFF